MVNLKSKKILVTGHNGFKGSWLCANLLRKGAQVYGVSLAPDNRNVIWDFLRQESEIHSYQADITDSASIDKVFMDVQPDVVVHLAAQPLVLESYRDPVETLYVNAIGTANVIMAAAKSANVRLFLNITTDKVYRNFDDNLSFSEESPLGGIDPYSMSKSCADFVGLSFYKSFLEKDGITLLNLRAGNVIGGGDMSKNRIIPDIVRAVTDGSVLQLRSPHSTRPWQHVLEPITIYTRLIEDHMDNSVAKYEEYNIGPEVSDLQTVQKIIDYARVVFPTLETQFSESKFHESKFLGLNIDKIQRELNYKPRLVTANSVALTLDWYRAWIRGDEMLEFTLNQIAQFESWYVS